MKNKENITIKSVTHCPTCGSECKVEGSTTHHYIPIKKYTEEDLMSAFNAGINNDYGNGSSFDQWLNSLNKKSYEK
jgi:hypothetical protein